jgi:aminoglycoside phosphotransferase (APT) family kinase protein
MGGVPPHQATHEVTVDAGRGVVVKRYRSWSRGEPAREWAALTLLAEFAPGLAPVPLRAALQADPPEIVMSFVRGTVPGARVTSAAADALGVALDRLWCSVPRARLAPAFGTEPVPAVFARRVRSMAGPARAVPGDSLAQQALSAGAAWLASSALGRRRAADQDAVPGQGAVLGQGDGNLANFLWDGGQVRIVDFEDSGLSDRAFELAVLVEHLSAWPDARLDPGSFLARFSLSGPQRARLTEYRRLSALFWLLMLLPGGPASTRNPPGTLGLQASRLLTLLG